jgi:hypothetical protein
MTAEITLKKYKLPDLVQMYKEAEQVDAEVFSEQRSNLQLVAGAHWNRKHSIFWNDRIRDNRSLSNEQKLRITQNHIYRVSKIRKNLLLTHSPGVRILPAQENDNQAQKAAQMNQSAWEFAKAQQNMRSKTQQFVSDFFDIGEVCAKVWWNQNGGAFKGYEQALDEIGQPSVDETGQPAPDEGKPVFEGCLEIERIFAFNLLRDPNVASMDASPWLMIRKMVQVEELRKRFDEGDERQKMIVEHKDETYVIFDANKQNYKRDKGVTTLKEMYIKPCLAYPMGYYYIFIETGILFEGELPFGIFPLVYEGHDEQPTTARHRSPIKQLRSFQVEINRAISSQAEESIVHGSAKLIMQAGAKLTPGEILPGLRAYHATGRDPVILPGVTGEQWVGYISQQVEGLYQAAMLEEEMQEKEAGQDAWGKLFSSMKQKKKFVMDAEKFEGFLCRLAYLYLDLFRQYAPDDIVIPAVGKTEIINISELRATTKLSYMIKAEPMSDDLESMFGKILSINHIMQYASGQLEREDIGKLIKLMPFANEEKMFDDFTLDYTRSENTLLALDRAETPEALPSDNGPYMIKKLTGRIAMADFSMLDDQIQANYKIMVTTYEELEAEKAQKMKAMEADFIDTSGPLIKVGWWIKDPTNPARSVQATLPASSINWLVQRLEEQSGFKQGLEGINSGSQANIADMYTQQQQQLQQQQSAPQGEAPGMPTNKGFMQ